MKKTISLAALAISASTSSFALVMPPANMSYKTYCLDRYTDSDGNTTMGSCDQSPNNARGNAQVGQNGCTTDQAALISSKAPWDKDFDIVINACMPPNAAQL